MKKNSTYIIAAVLVVLILGGIYYFIKEEPIVLQETKAPLEEIPNIRLVDNKLVEVKDGKIKWELSVGGLEFDKKANQVYLVNVKGIFYQDNGSKLNMTAEKAVMDTDKKNIVMTGSVQAESSDGGIITADEMKWLSDQERIVGSGNVKLTKNDVIITGDILESDAKLDKVKVHGNARVLKGGE